MANVLKVLGQLKPGAASLGDLYTVPALTATVGSTITICNQSATADSYRVAVRVAGAAINVIQYLFFDAPIAGNQTQTWTLGLALATTDVVSVRSTNGTTSFNLFGQENS